jgi:DNA primase
LNDTQGDPIKKANLIRDIVETIARVPDAIARAAYIRHTSDLMEMAETVLINELNKILRKNNKKAADDFPPVQEPGPGEDGSPPDPLTLALQQEEAVVVNEFDTLTQEEEIIRILLLYADQIFYLPVDEPSANGEKPSARVKDFIISQLKDDGIHFSNEVYAALLAAFSAQFEEGLPYSESEFLMQLDPAIKNTAISVMTPPYELAKWEEHKIDVKREIDQLHKTVIDPVMYIKKKQLGKIKDSKIAELKARQEGGIPYDDLLVELQDINYMQMQLNKFTNTVIQK